MKLKYFILSLILLVFFTTQAQICNIGNQESTSDFTDGSFSANFLVGTKFTLAEDGLLNAFNFIGNNSGSQIQMAVYNDNNGTPADLIASSEIGSVGSGVTSLGTTATNLPAGDYWIMAIYDTAGNHVNTHQSALDTQSFYQALTFGSTLPSNASGFSSFYGQDYLYYLDITCASAFNCNVGNQQTTSEFTDGSFSANVLVGTKVTLTQEGTLNAINLIGNNSGSRVQMAVYNGINAPLNLLAESEIGVVGDGVVSLPVEPITLIAGNYWVMAIYEDAGNHVNTNQTANDTQVFYQELTFESALPSYAGNFSSFYGQDYLYFLDIECTPASDCTIGNYEATSDFVESPHTANVITGSKYHLAEQGLMKSFDLIGNNTGSRVQMALYSDDNGAPGTLIYYSTIGTVSQGRTSFPVTPYHLVAGDYWIMAIYEDYGTHSDVSYSTSTEIYNYYKSHTFGEPFPNDASNFDLTVGKEFLYFVDTICQSTLSIDEPELKQSIKLFPNPASENITISGLRFKEKYTMYDSLGRIMMKNYIENKQSIAVQNLNPGLYFLKFENGQTLKFIKK